MVLSWYLREDEKLESEVAHLKVSGLEEFCMEIVAAAPSNGKSLLVRDVYETPPLVLSFLRLHPDTEVVEAVETGGFMPEFKEVFPKVLHGESKAWLLWGVRATPEV